MSEANTYDEIPYPDLAFPQTHPNRTAAMARLFGVPAPDPTRARVLELGCAAGANLLPMGVEMPEAQFIGVDLSRGQIEAGEALRHEAGIGNVTLLQADILDPHALEGTFDYIIAHGVYSWVPPVVAERVLALCRERLAPNGVAYISYNVYPGWHYREALRGMMMYHAAGFADPKARIPHGKALVEFVAGHAPSGFHADTLKAGMELLRGGDDNYLYHEYLEAANHPAYFHQFVDRTRAAGLEYLGGSQLAGVATKTLPPATLQALQRVSGGDPLRMEQYADFVTNRSFRESLLVHREQARRPAPDPAALGALWVTHWLVPSGPFDPSGPGATAFESRTGAKISLKDPFAKTALAVLIENHGHPLRLEDLAAATRGRLGSGRGAEKDVDELGRFFLELLAHGVAEITAAPWPGTREIAEQPRTSRLARNQARAGQSIVTLRHQRLDSATPDHRGLIELLDGTRTVAEAIDRMFERVDPNKLPPAARALAGDPARLRAAFEESMRAVVADLRNLGLLLA